MYEGAEKRKYKRIEKPSSFYEDWRTGKGNDKQSNCRNFRPGKSNFPDVGIIPFPS
ncbi:MAG: hypothetical protein ACYSR0_02125 [Planctomycetota bacterium]|jgi:hypothetical protein